jgi:ATP-dependent DNA helicase RecG
MSRTEIQGALGLKHKGNFRINYIDPALEQGFIELKHPENPNHPKQKYKLTEQGKKLKKEMSML